MAKAQKCVVLLEDAHYKNLGYFLSTNTRLLLSVAVEMREARAYCCSFISGFYYNLFYCVILVMGSYKQLSFNFFFSFIHYLL